jgi:hypothetical protein
VLIWDWEQEDAHCEVAHTTLLDDAAPIERNSVTYALYTVNITQLLLKETPSRTLRVQSTSRKYSNILVSKKT